MLLPPAQTPLQERQDKQLEQQVKALLQSRGIAAGECCWGTWYLTWRLRHPSPEDKAALAAIGCRLQDDGLLLVNRRYKTEFEWVDVAPMLLQFLVFALGLLAAAGAVHVYSIGDV